MRLDVVDLRKGAEPVKNVLELPEQEAYSLGVCIQNATERKDTQYWYLYDRRFAPGKPDAYSEIDYRAFASECGKTLEWLDKGGAAGMSLAKDRAEKYKTLLSTIKAEVEKCAKDPSLVFFPHG